MTGLKYTVVDVFTDAPLTGNPLAVFLDASPLSGETMQALAREMNLSETTFILPPERGGDARVRIFTPRAEIPFAGHPTLGTAAVLARDLRAQGWTEDSLNLELPVGVVPIRFEGNGPEEKLLGWFTRPVPKPIDFPRAEELLDALGVTATRSPVCLYDNGMRHAVVQLGSPAGLASLAPNLGAVARLPLDTVDVFAAAGTHAELRVFAPVHGVPEDAATGSAAAPLRQHLLEFGELSPDATLSISQGASLSRPSRILTRRATIAGRSEPHVEVGGGAIVVATGEFHLPA